MISEEELRDLLRNPENPRIEKSISLTNFDKFGEAICAFGNDLPNFRLPGYLLLGVKDGGTLTNIRIEEKTIQAILDFKTNGNIVPPPALIVEQFNLDGSDVLVVEVQPSIQPPVRYKGATYVRNGPRKGRANDQEERMLSEKRSSFAKTFDLTPCFEATLTDIVIGIFKETYLPNAIDAETLRENGRDIKAQLASLKFYDLITDKPTNAGILMFSDNPLAFLPGAYIQYLHFMGESEDSAIHNEVRFSGDFVTQLKSIRNFIFTQVVKTSLPALGEEYVYNYPKEALMELLLNAIIHRDYQSNAPIKFYQFSDRIEITNPGGLYGIANVENFPNANDYRNPAITEGVKNLGYVNRFNVGVKRAKSALMKNGNPNPEFLIDQTSTFGVIIFSR
jgi:ATP-dependent DNA helicase RecG